MAEQPRWLSRDVIWSPDEVAGCSAQRAGRPSHTRVRRTMRALCMLWGVLTPRKELVATLRRSFSGCPVFTQQLCPQGRSAASGDVTVVTLGGRVLLAPRGSGTQQRTQQRPRPRAPALVPGLRSPRSCWGCGPRQRPPLRPPPGRQATDPSGHAGLTSHGGLAWPGPQPQSPRPASLLTGLTQARGYVPGACFCPGGSVRPPDWNVGVTRMRPGPSSLVRSSQH